MIRRLPVYAAALLLLVGCGATQGPGASSSPSTASSPTPETASPARVWQVLAPYAPAWRVTAEHAVECRTLWVLARDAAPGSLERVKAEACYLDESAMTLTARKAAGDLSNLTVGSADRELYSATLRTLNEIVAADVQGACGGPEVTEGCREATRGLHFYYLDLVDHLNRWDALA